MRHTSFCRTGSPPLIPIPDLGRQGSEGGDAGDGAVTLPSRLVLMTGSGSCTQTCKHCRNEVMEKLRGKTACSLCGMEGGTPFHSPLTLLMAYGFRKEERLFICDDHLKIDCSRFSLSFLKHPMFLQDSWHDRNVRLTRNARLTLTSGIGG